MLWHGMIVFVLTCYYGYSGFSRAQRLARSQSTALLLAVSHANDMLVVIGCRNSSSSRGQYASLLGAAQSHAPPIMAFLKTCRLRPLDSLVVGHIA